MTHVHDPVFKRDITPEDLRIGTSLYRDIRSGTIIRDRCLIPRIQCHTRVRTRFGPLRRPHGPGRRVLNRQKCWVGQKGRAHMRFFGPCLGGESVVDRYKESVAARLGDCFHLGQSTGIEGALEFSEPIRRSGRCWQLQRIRQFERERDDLSSQLF